MSGEISQELAGRCGGCKFGHPLCKPGPKPEVPPEPNREGFWGWLLGGEDFFARWIRTLPLTEWSIRKDCYDNLVICKRFPSSVEKSKSSTCGEYAPSIALNETHR